MISWNDEIVTCRVRDLEDDGLLPAGFTYLPIDPESAKTLVDAADTVAAENGYKFVQVLASAGSAAVVIFRRA